MDAWVKDRRAELLATYAMTAQRLKTERQPRTALVDGKRVDVDHAILEWARPGMPRQRRQGIVGDGGVGKTTELLHLGQRIAGGSDGNTPLFGMATLPLRLV